ncbi:MAG: hypothetical protein LUF87_02800 [Alistipes sp.]|nr:hypothetical protein [Alistipes sp.]
MKLLATGLLSFLFFAVDAGMPVFNPELGAHENIDSVFVRKTLWPDTEKYELVIAINGEDTVIYTVYSADGSLLQFLFGSGDKTDGF